MNVTKKAKDLCTGSYKTLLGKIKGDPNEYPFVCELFH